MRSAILSVLVMGILFLPPVADADICNTINSLSNGWAEVANALDNSGEVEIADLDLPRLVREVDALLTPTEDLGEFLVDEGNFDEEDMGDELLDYVEDLRDTEGEDFVSYLVEVIDDLIYTLDDVVDYCDE